MDADTRARWQAALADPRVRARYAAKITRAGDGDHWWWCGAIHPHGHGRFWIGRDEDRTNIVVIAHRYGYALAHGLDALQAAPVLAHTCDEASCQNPAHLTPSSTTANLEDWIRRHHTPGSPLRDTRGPDGRARAIRNAIRAHVPDVDLTAVLDAGAPPLDRNQLFLPAFTSHPGAFSRSNPTSPQPGL